MLILNCKITITTKQNKSSTVLDIPTGSETKSPLPSWLKSPLEPYLKPDFTPMIAPPLTPKNEKTIVLDRVHDITVSTSLENLTDTCTIKIAPKYKLKGATLDAKDILKLITEGDYQVKVMTQYTGGSTLLKSPKTFLYPKLLSVS